MATKLGCALVVLLAATPAFAASPRGDWLVEDKTAIIHIDSCGSAMCGTIVWTKKQGGVDENNPDPAKRTRPIMGLQLLLGMKPASDGRWEGDIYNPENGKTYSSRMWLKSDDMIRVEGCVLGFLCGGQDWTRTKLETPAAASPQRPAPSKK
jgi:uncharacterized protein (DUF2147 family)